jgi:glycosyltransferase involved in cell wall biosynthesis
MLRPSDATQHAQANSRLYGLSTILPNHVTLFLPSLTGGGAERVMVNLASGLLERGFATDFVLADATGPYLPLVPPGVRLINLNVSRMLHAVRPLVSYLRRERPAALLVALDHANVAAMAAGCIARSDTRIVISVHATLGSGRTIRERTIPHLLSHCHHWAHGIVAVSTGVADDLAATTAIPRSKITVIYNPVITPALFETAREHPPHPWFNDGRAPIVLGVGRLVPHKRFSLLIDAFAIVRRYLDVRLVILGEGPEQSALENQVHRRGLQELISLAGFVPNPYACIARAAVFAFTSSGLEGLPTVLIESLALGTPVVSTDCDYGPREILRGGALGVLVPVDDAFALAEAITATVRGPRRVVPAEALDPFRLDRALTRYQGVLRIEIGR